MPSDSISQPLPVDGIDSLRPVLLPRSNRNSRKRALVRMLATVRHHAMELTEYGFTVPLISECRCRFLYNSGCVPEPDVRQPRPCRERMLHHRFDVGRFLGLKRKPRRTRAMRAASHDVLAQLDALDEIRPRVEV